MPQSLSQVYIHLVFSTKERYPYIDNTIKPKLFAYMADTIKRCEGVPLLINGMTDHVHIFSSLPRSMSLSKYIEEIKRNSSRWLKTIGSQYQNFAWQKGYGVFSVSSSQKEIVMRYIAEQEDHHQNLTFKEEFILFLKKHHVQYDEKYLWN